MAEQYGSTVYFIPDLPTYGILAFDVTKSESHTFNTTTTDNPIEGGATITDHFIDDPQVFSFEALTSETPGIRNFYGDSSDVEVQTIIPVRYYPPTLIPVIDSQETMTIRGVGRLSGVDAQSLVQKQLERIETLKNARALGTITTSARTYLSMAIVHVELIRGPNGLGAGSFKIDCRQISVVETGLVAAPKPKEPRGAAIQKQGKKAALDLKQFIKDKAAEFFGKDSSVLNNITGG